MPTTARTRRRRSSKTALRWYSGANGKLAVKLGVQGKYSPSVKPVITYKGLPTGGYKLEVYVANNDHTNTGAEASTTFKVK